MIAQVITAQDLPRSIFRVYMQYMKEDQGNDARLCCRTFIVARIGYSEIYRVPSYIVTCGFDCILAARLFLILCAVLIREQNSV